MQNFVEIFRLKLTVETKGGNTDMCAVSKQESCDSYLTSCSSHSLSGLNTGANVATKYLGAERVCSFCLPHDMFGPAECYLIARPCPNTTSDRHLHAHN